MRVLFTICARAGSKGFKNKNLKEMNGIPLVYYTIATVKAYRDAHEDYDIDVALNTDSEELIELCQKQKEVVIKAVERKPQMAGDVAPKVDVIQDTYLNMSQDGDYDIIVDLDITSPLRTLSDIEEAIRVYQSDESYDIVYSVVPSRRSPYFNMVEDSDDGYHHLVCPCNLSARQQAPDCYEMNASIYVYSPYMLQGKIDKVITDFRSSISIMKDYLVLDIDSEDDFRMMEFLYGYYIKNDDGLRQIYEEANNM